MIISKGNSLGKGMFGTNRGISEKIHLILYKKIRVLRQRLLLSECRPSLS